MYLVFDEEAAFSFRINIIKISFKRKRFFVHLRRKHVRYAWLIMLVLQNKKSKRITILKPDTLPQRCWKLKNQHLCLRLVLCSLCCFFPHVWYRVSWVTTWCLSPCQVHVPVKIYGNHAWTTMHSTSGNPLTRLQNLGTQAESRRSHSKKWLFFIAGVN